MMLRRLLWFPMGILLLLCIWGMARAMVYHQPKASLPTFDTQAPTTTETVPSESLSSQLPLVLPGTELMIEALVTYEGPFLEDLSDEETVIAGIVLQNFGAETVTFARIEGISAKCTLTFDVTHLPAGARVLVGELDRNPLPDEVLTWRCIGLSTQPGTNFAASLNVSPESPCTLSITNSSETSVGRVTIYYKQYNPQADMFLGGITYCAVVTDLAPWETRKTAPYHFVHGYSQVVGIKTAPA